MTDTAPHGLSTVPSTASPAGLLARLFNSEHVRSTEVAGKQWFSAKDACAVIGITDDRAACDGLDKAEVSYAKLPTYSGLQTVRVISKEAAIDLLLRSRKPQAVEFKRWMVQTVLNTKIRL